MADRNKFKEWMRKSREEERRNPGKFLASYPDLEIDNDHVWMEQDTYNAILRNCGTFSGLLPPKDQFCGRLFLSGRKLCWFGIDKENTENIKVNSRIILIKAGTGPALPVQL